MTAQSESDAIVADARDQLDRLRAWQRRLICDADDPVVLSEIVWLDGLIKRAEAELGIAGR